MQATNKVSKSPGRAGMIGLILAASLFQFVAGSYFPS
jgi:hypothetical protein